MNRSEADRIAYAALDDVLQAAKDAGEAAPSPSTVVAFTLDALQEAGAFAAERPLPPSTTERNHHPLATGLPAHLNFMQQEPELQRRQHMVREHSFAKASWPTIRADELDSQHAYLHRHDQ